MEKPPFLFCKQLSVLLTKVSDQVVEMQGRHLVPEELSHGLPQRVARARQQGQLV